MREPNFGKSDLATQIYRESRVQVKQVSQSCSAGIPWASLRADSADCCQAILASQVGAGRPTTAAGTAALR